MVCRPGTPHSGRCLAMRAVVKWICAELLGGMLNGKTDHKGTSMKNIRTLLKIAYLVVVLVSVLGVYVASQVYRHYSPVAYGCVGAAAIYYSYRYNLLPKKQNLQSADLFISFPRGFQQLVYAFLLSLILSWAGFQTVDMFFWIVNIIKVQ